MSCPLAMGAQNSALRFRVKFRGPRWGVGVCVSHPGMPLVPQGAMKSQISSNVEVPREARAAHSLRLRHGRQDERGGQVYEPPTGGRTRSPPKAQLSPQHRGVPAHQAVHPHTLPRGQTWSGSHGPPTPLAAYGAWISCDAGSALREPGSRGGMWTWAQNQVEEVVQPRAGGRLGGLWRRQLFGVGRMGELP